MAGLYYPHDLNARNDPKCVRLRMTTGAAGYGVFNILLELLGSEPSHTLPTDYEAIAWDEHLDAELIRQVVNDFDLFVVTDDGSQFYSRRMLEQFEAIDGAKQRRANAAKKGANARWGNADAMQTQCDCLATAEQPQSNSNANAMRLQCDCNAIAQQPDSDCNADAMRPDSNSNAKKRLINIRLINNAADAALTRVRTREEAAAASAEQNLNTQTVAPDVQQLLEDIGKRFDTIPLPAHLTALEQLISECNRPGVVNGVDVVRDGLARLDTAEAIKSGKVRLSLTQFLQPKYFTRLISGDYDKAYNSKRKSGYSGAGISFEGREY